MEFQRIAIRADKTDQSFNAVIHLAAAAHPEVRSVRIHEDMKNPGWISSRDFRCGGECVGL